MNKFKLFDILTNLNFLTFKIFDILTNLNFLKLVQPGGESTSWWLLVLVKPVLALTAHASDNQPTDTTRCVFSSVFVGFSSSVFVDFNCIFKQVIIIP